MVISSFWSETYAGWVVHRLKNRKNPGISIMRDYQRVDFIERMRAMHPDIFRHSEEYVANEEKIVSVPAYLTDECIVHFTSKATALELDARASSALDTYLSENALEAKSSALESLSSVRLGSRQIHTMRSEEDLLSSDSVICARFLEGKEERYSRYSQKH